MVVNQLRALNLCLTVAPFPQPGLEHPFISSCTSHTHTHMVTLEPGLARRPRHGSGSIHSWLLCLVAMVTSALLRGHREQLALVA